MDGRRRTEVIMESGDLMGRYAEIAEQEERIKLRREDDRAQPPVVALADVVGNMMEKDKTLATNHGSASYHFAAASTHFRQRAHFLGLPEAAGDVMVAKARAYCDDAAKTVESPIERMLLPWLVMEDYGPKIGTIPAPVYIAKDKYLCPKGEIVIIPQSAFIRARLDFAVVTKHNGTLRIVAVECDGKDFHSAQRDTLRDGFLASFGIPTVRASGSLIHTRPRDISARVSALLQEMME